MILDHLNNAYKYVGLHPSFAAAFEYLHETKLASMPVGEHEILGRKLYVSIGRGEGTGPGKALEAHRAYIDIQFALAGTDRIGWAPLHQLTRLTHPYQAEKDIEFYGDAAVSHFDLPPGAFCIFFPHDAHAPMQGKGLLHKAVIKVAVE